MTTVTLRFQSTGQVPGDGRPVVMRGPSLTIGRGPGNDMVLPDPDRMISSSHAVIENHNGNVVVVDLSSNGTFLNYGKIALGRTPTPLNSGDVLIMGGYELVVELSRPQQMIADPMEDFGIGHGRAERAAGIGSLLDGPGPETDFVDDLLGRDVPKGPGQLKLESDDPLGDDGGLGALLDPLGDDPVNRPYEAGAGEFNHGASDLIRSPRAAQGGIPEDWDDDFLGGGAPSKGSAGLGAPAAPAGPALGDFDSLLEPAAPAHSPAGAPAAPAGSGIDIFDLGDLSEPEPPGSAPAADFSGIFDEAQPAAPVAAPAPPEAAPPAGPQQVPEPEPASAFAPAPAMPEPVAAAPAMAAQPVVAQPVGGDEDTVRAFLRALGADEVVKPEERHSTMVRLGGVLRTMITGIREVLMTRTQFKGEFRIDQTMIAASGNNPLKFSVSPEQAVEAMSRQGARGYLSAQEATRQALGDIRAHEVAMVTGMEAALKGVLSRLDPKTLEEKLAKRGGAGFFANKKAKYWELYEEMYAEISDQAENQFHDLFAREFAAAYKAQLERLK